MVKAKFKLLFRQTSPHQNVRNIWSGSLVFTELNEQKCWCMSKTVLKLHRCFENTARDFYCSVTNIYEILEDTRKKKRREKKAIVLDYAIRLSAVYTTGHY